MGWSFRPAFSFHTTATNPGFHVDAWVLAQAFTSPIQTKSHMADGRDLPDVEDPDADVINRCESEKTVTGDPCQIQVSEPWQTCGKHPNPPGGQPGNAGGDGAPEGNDHAKGHGAPEGNTNAMKTGEFMSLSRKRDYLIEHYGEEVAQLYFERLEEYRDVCMSDSRAHKLAIMDVFSDIMMEELLDDQFTTTFYTDVGDPYEAFDEDRFGAFMKAQKEVRMGLHYEGHSAIGSGSSGSAGHSNRDKLVSPADGGDSSASGSEADGD